MTNEELEAMKLSDEQLSRIRVQLSAVAPSSITGWVGDVFALSNHTRYLEAKVRDLEAALVRAEHELQIIAKPALGGKDQQYRAQQYFKDKFINDVAVKASAKLTPAPSASQEDSPRCPKCGYVMCQQFDDKPINAVASLAIPNGKYACYNCASPSAKEES